MATENRNESQPSAAFTAREERLASLLAAGWTVVAAAAEVGMSERQAHAWKVEKPGFMDLVNRLRAEMFATALGKLASLQTKAADTLEELLDEKYPPAVRLSAARGILADAATIRQSVELDQRLTELEGRLP